MSLENPTKLEDFITKIDSLITANVYETFAEDISPDWVDIMNFQERSRCNVIKDHISSTHDWLFASCVDSQNFVTECFLCERCGIRASAFEYIGCLSIISKVTDDKPTYTPHNQYLMYTCAEVMHMHAGAGEPRCFECAIFEPGKTDACSISFDEK